MPPWLFADKFQTENISIEYFGLIEVIDVEGRFDKMLNASIVHGSLRKIKEQHFGGFDCMQCHARFIADRSPIAGQKPLPIDFHRSS